jgi:hypothetical protein
MPAPVLVLAAVVVNLPLPVGMASKMALPVSLVAILREEPTCSVRWPWSPW